MSDLQGHRRRLGARFAVLAAMGLLIVLAAAARGQPYGELVCGMPRQETLAAGAKQMFAVRGHYDDPGDVVVDVTDTSGSIGALLLEEPPPGYPQQSCDGTLQMKNYGLVAVSDCLGADAGTFTIVAHIVSGGEDNCGVELRCDRIVDQEEISILGDVNAYTFFPPVGAPVVVSVTGSTEAMTSIRLRVFDPDGNSVPGTDSCRGSVGFTPSRSGQHSVLVSACNGLETGQYSLRWRPEAGCPPSGEQGEFVYVANGGSGTVAVVDAVRQQIAAVIPVVTPGRGSGFARLTLAPNNGFAIATFEDSRRFSLINTTTNRADGGLAFNLLEPEQTFAIHPSGRVLYAPSAALGGVAIVDTRTRRQSGLMPFEGLSEMSPVGVTTDGTAVYVALEAGRIGVFDVAAGGYSREIADSRLGSIIGFAFPPIGAFAYVVSEGRLIVVDTAAHEVVATVPVEPLIVSDSSMVAFSADGLRAYIVVASDPGAQTGRGVAAINTANHSVAGSIPVPGVDVPGGVAISRNGKVLYVTDGHARPERGEAGLVALDSVSGAVLARIPTFGEEPGAVAVAQVPAGLCASDDQSETKVTIGELVPSVSYALYGCPNEPLVAPPPTPGGGAPSPP